MQDDLLDKEEVIIESNNKKTTSIFLSVFLTITLLRAYIVARVNTLMHNLVIPLNSDLLVALLSILVFLIGLVYAIKFYRNKEERTKGYYFGVYGHLILLLLAVNVIAMNA